MTAYRRTASPTSTPRWSARSATPGWPPSSPTALRYHCHVGHSFSPLTLLAAQDDKVEKAIWTAVSHLQEQAMIHTYLAERSGSSALGNFEAGVAQSRQRAANTLLRQLHLLRPPSDAG
jgi:hypothetical protein